MAVLTQAIISFLVLLLEICSALVASMAVLRALLQYLLILFRPVTTQDMPFIRLRLGQSLLLALEFMVGAEILRTALSPTWNDLLRLAALIGLRTLLSFVLMHELRMIGEHLGLR